MLLPFVDRGPERAWPRRPAGIGATILIVLALVTLTVLAALTAAETHL